MNAYEYLMNGLAQKAIEDHFVTPEGMVAKEAAFAYVAYHDFALDCLQDVVENEDDVANALENQATDKVLQYLTAIVQDEYIINDFLAPTDDHEYPIDVADLVHRLSNTPANQADFFKM